MKTIKFLALGAVVALLSSCGVSNRHDEIEELNKKSKWDEEQTNRAIDIYLEGIDEYCDIMEDAFLIGEKDISYKYRGDKDVIKERKDEIKEAEKQWKETKKEIEKKYKQAKKNYDDSYEDYDYDNDYDY